MSHRPVCSQCETEFQCHKNDVVVVDHAHFGPYKLFSADEWRCPKCGMRIVVGFADNSYAEHYQDHFAAALEKIPDGLVRNNYELATEEVTP